MTPLWSTVLALVEVGNLDAARALAEIIAAVAGPYQEQAKAFLAGLLDRREATPTKARGGASRGAVRSWSRSARRSIAGSDLRADGEDESLLDADLPYLEVSEAIPPRSAPSSKDLRRASDPSAPKLRKAKTGTPRVHPVISRFPHMDLPTDSLSPGDTFKVEVYADRKAPSADEKSRAVRIEGKDGQDSYRVNVWIAGTSHFTFDMGRSGAITIDVRSDCSTRAVFAVGVNEVLDPAPAELFAYFTYDGRPSGRVSRVVKLDRSTTSGADSGREASVGRPHRSGVRIATNEPSADLTIEITDPQRTRQHMMCKVSSRLLQPHEEPEPEEWHLDKESGEIVRGYMDEFVNSKNHRAYSLIGAGKLLFAAAPKVFKDTLFTLLERGTPPRTILITSEEPNIPWELMIPHWGLEEPRQALGVEFSVGRWIKDDHLSPSAAINLKASLVVAPVYQVKPKPLAKAEEEAALVLGAVPGARVKPADLKSISAALDASSASLLHFICHGVDADSAGGVQAIFLENGQERLTSLEILGIPAIVKALRRKPVVFLNACEVGRPKVALTGIGGFASAFLRLGAAAVIAPLWSVKDRIAFDVAAKFYANAVASSGPRRPFADVMREVRLSAYDEATGEDTYAAYCFYGDPSARASGS